MEEKQEELSKKERSELRRADKEKTQQQAQAARKMKKYTKWGGALLVIGLLIFWGVSTSQKAEESRPGEQQENEGRDHIGQNEEHNEYQTNPPTSGSHAGAIRFGIYENEIPDENAIHNMEHGGIWISYKDISDEELALLEAIARKAPRAILLSPRSANDTPIAVASWQRLMKLDEVDVERIEEYVEKNINRSPEPLAS